LFLGHGQEESCGVGEEALAREGFLQKDPYLSSIPTDSSIMRNILGWNLWKMAHQNLNVAAPFQTFSQLIIGKYTHNINIMV